MEEILAYWQNSETVVEERVGERALQVVVARAAEPLDARGEACCYVGRGGKPEGTFILKRDQAGAFVTGYLMPAVGDVYRFDRLALAANATWRDLLARVRNVLATAYSFPDDWGVRREHFELPKK